MKIYQFVVQTISSSMNQEINSIKIYLFFVLFSRSFYQLINLKSYLFQISKNDQQNLVEKNSINIFLKIKKIKTDEYNLHRIYLFIYLVIFNK
jgi:hypothetical protein